MKGLSLVNPTSPRRGLSCHFDSANEKDFALETQCTLMDKLPSHYNTIRFQHLDTVLMLNCGQANHMTKSVKMSDSQFLGKSCKSFQNILLSTHRWSECHQIFVATLGLGRDVSKIAEVMWIT